MSYIDYVELCIAILKKEGTLIEFIADKRMTGRPIGGALIGKIIYTRVDTDDGIYITDITKIVSYTENGVKKPFPRHKDTSQEKITI